MDERGSHRMGMMIPLVVFVLVSVLCCGVLAGVFLRAADIAVRAGDYTAGVQLCRNTAELCRAGQDEDLSVRCYDGNYQVVESSQARYRVAVIFADEPTASGVLRTYTITACNREQEPLYTLETVIYLPEEVPHEH